MLTRQSSAGKVCGGLVLARIMICFGLEVGVVVGQEEKQANPTVFEVTFESDSDGDGIADGCKPLGNADIETKYSLDLQAKEGKRSQKIEVVESMVSEQVGIATKYFALSTDKSYRFNLWYKTSELENAYAFAFAGWYNKDEKCYERLDIIPPTGVGTATEWTLVTATLKPKVNGEANFHARIVVSKPGGTGCVWYDRLRVEEE